MSTLDNQQKQLIFDYSLGLTTKKESAEAEELIGSSEQAAELHAALQSITSALDSLESELCPDELVERTILRLTNTARTSEARLAQLLADEQAKTAVRPWRLWWNAGRVLAAAAVILIAAGVWFAPLNFVRQQYYQQRCQMQLARIAGGVEQYMADHDGQMPAVATTAGAPWWKVGYQGDDNYSNTRHLWLLVRGGYVEPVNFVCPGTKRGQVVLLDSSQVKDYNDFPNRKHVTFSFRIRCDKPQGASPTSRGILISDLNPLFESLPAPDAKPPVIQLNKELSNLNSANHNRRGQNVLLNDGSVKFLKTRGFGTAEDDIFTLQNTKVYQGVEVPLCESDTFLAP
ncbi:MAG: hypothetical protein MUP16_06090 [Sedimentisphaerales bacterium]|nr:hypothetical protein [Sedimentisphaerales bacterium]